LLWNSVKTFLFPSRHPIQQISNAEPKGISHPENGHPRRACGGRSLVVGLPQPLDGCLRRTPSIYGFVAEMRNLVQRMKFRRARRHYIWGLDFGAYIQQEPDGPRNFYTRIHACIADIGSFVDAHPSATMVDVEFYRDAWVKGWEYAIRTGDSGKLENEDSLLTTSD